MLMYIPVVVVGAFLNIAEAATAQYDCTATSSTFGVTASCNGLCDWEQNPSTGIWAVVCDLRNVCGNTDEQNALEAVVNGSSGGYGDDDIVIQGECNMAGSATIHCCIFEDSATSAEIENVVLFGTTNSDYLAFRTNSGTAQLDRLGRAGALMMNGWAYGLAGADRIRGSLIAVPTDYLENLFGGDGPDYVFGNGGPDELDGGPGIDFIDGSVEDDQINGGPGDNVVVAGRGSDIVVTGNDDDLICAETASGVPSGIDYKWGATGIFAPSGSLTYDPNTWGITCTTATSGFGNDVVDAGNGDNRVYTGIGADEVVTGSGVDKVCMDGASNGGVPDSVISGPNAGDANDSVYFWDVSPTGDIDGAAGSSDNCSLTSGSRVNCELSTISACPF
jgi:Ca2+-binding RTX toxin-like protein